LSIQGPPGERGLPGERGEKGDPGESIRGEKGERGEIGPMGLGMEDLTAELDEVKGIVTLIAKRGEHSHVIAELPWTVQRGTYKPGQTYYKWNVITEGGQEWKARRETTSKPPGPDWWLCVRAGAPGKAGKDGKDGAPGPAGRPGRDLTQMGLDGVKY
jgi:hypothetical protein